MLAQTAAQDIRQSFPKDILFCNQLGAVMSFSCRWTRKGPKEISQRSASSKSIHYGRIATGNPWYLWFAARSTTPLEPPAASPSSVQKCPDFWTLTAHKAVDLLSLDYRKSGHFHLSDGDSAGVSKGVVLRAANQKSQWLPVAIIQ